MAGWVEFATAFVVFLASHAVPPRTGIRGVLTARMGEGGYLAAYILVSLVILLWLISAAGHASYIELWAPAAWTRWAPNLLMPLACFFFAFGAAASNPLSFAGRNSERFNPDRPGIVALCRHPILLGFALWASGHLIANGDLAHVILFGFFLLMAVTGMFALDRRMRRRHGEQEWADLARRTRLAPVSLSAFSSFARSLRTTDLVRLVAAVLLYGALISLHRTVIGVSPLPMLPTG